MIGARTTRCPGCPSDSLAAAPSLPIYRQREEDNSTTAFESVLTINCSLKFHPGIHHDNDPWSQSLPRLLWRKQKVRLRYQSLFCTDSKKNSTAWCGCFADGCRTAYRRTTRCKHRHECTDSSSMDDMTGQLTPPGLYSCRQINIGS